MRKERGYSPAQWPAVSLAARNLYCEDLAGAAQGRERESHMWNWSCHFKGKVQWSGLVGALLSLREILPYSEP